MAVRKATAATESNETATAAEITTETVKAAETANTASEKVKVIYVGPTLPAGQLKCNRVFDGTKEEIKESLKEVIEKYPLIEKMLVPVSELAEKKQKIKTPDNIYNKYYADLVALVAAGEKEE